MAEQVEHKRKLSAIQHFMSFPLFLVPFFLFPFPSSLFPLPSSLCGTQAQALCHTALDGLSPSLLPLVIVSLALARFPPALAPPRAVREGEVSGRRFGEEGDAREEELTRFR
eukprot:1047014-Rhodomonas_salina.3